LPAIKVQQLTKTFVTREKQPGLRGSVRAFLRPVRRETHAVKGITFGVEEGERVAFIGPNGAGKSTTIKMLVGILYPTSGQAQVLGKTPWRERKRLAYQIGAVFGQKSQLWYHLPPADSFDLLARIYELDGAAYRQRLAHLVELFEVGDYLQVPARKLSLGERMRCEVAASLLHRPRILFLDEPTIGLDVVVKQRIRDLKPRRTGSEAQRVRGQIGGEHRGRAHRGGSGATAGTVRHCGHQRGQPADGGDHRPYLRGRMGGQGDKGTRRQGD